jgi:hypothetical protein
MLAHSQSSRDDNPDGSGPDNWLCKSISYLTLCRGENLHDIAVTPVVKLLMGPNLVQLAEWLCRELDSLPGEQHG